VKTFIGVTSKSEIEEAIKWKRKSLVLNDKDFFNIGSIEDYMLHH
jgi:hypothetical protein